MNIIQLERTRKTNKVLPPATAPTHSISPSIHSCEISSRTTSLSATSSISDGQCDRPIASSKQIYCCYINRTTKFQIVRVVTIAHGLLERMVIPQARIFFEASPHEHLEVHVGNPITSILSDKIPCYQLAYTENNFHE
ncbi:MAG: DUF1830 domain-containing protein [Phormidesmis sp. RL_2_1]|nr:DUF1830 domain-containing protein [Phormidesmis sp. RL_2_1]